MPGARYEIYLVIRASGETYHQQGPVTLACSGFTVFSTVLLYVSVGDALEFLTQESCNI